MPASILPVKIDTQSDALTAVSFTDGVPGTYAVLLLRKPQAVAGLAGTSKPIVPTHKSVRSSQGFQCTYGHPRLHCSIASTQGWHWEPGLAQRI